MDVGRRMMRIGLVSGEWDEQHKVVRHLEVPTKQQRREMDRRMLMVSLGDFHSRSGPTVVALKKNRYNA